MPVNYPPYYFLVLQFVVWQHVASGLFSAPNSVRPFCHYRFDKFFNSIQTFVTHLSVFCDCSILLDMKHKHACSSLPIFLSPGPKFMVHACSFRSCSMPVPFLAWFNPSDVDIILPLLLGFWIHLPTHALPLYCHSAFTPSMEQVHYAHCTDRHHTHHTLHHPALHFIYSH